MGVAAVLIQSSWMIMATAIGQAMVTTGYPAFEEPPHIYIYLHNIYIYIYTYSYYALHSNLDVTCVGAFTLMHAVCLRWED